MITINPRTAEAYKLLHEGTLALARAEQAGIRVDMEYIEKKKEFLSRKIARLEEQFMQSNFCKHWFHSMKRVNINSNAQLAYFLYDIKKLKPAYLTSSGQGATDEEALKQLKIPELEELLEIRKLKKVRDTYLDAFAREQVDGYLHPSFNLNLVKTFRSSSDGPNFQNIPKRDEESMNIVRRALYPRPGHQLLEADFSGLEVGIACCYHKDPNMIKYIETDPGALHTDMAKQIYMIDNLDRSIPSHAILRYAAKNGFVFPEFYGDYFKNCAESLATWVKLPTGTWSREEGILLPTGPIGAHFAGKGIKSLTAFTKHIERIEQDFWRNRFPYYAAWKESWWKLYQKYGYVDLKTGFRCSGIMGKNDCLNYPVQGAAFHCLLWSFIQVDKISQEEGWDSRLIGQIHDSMILDVNPSELNHVKKVIKKITCVDLPKVWQWICVPLQIDIETYPVDCSWVEKEDIK